MRNKRGLSQVVTTILVILLVLVALATVWVVVNEFVLQGTSKIDLTRFTLDLGIKKAEINYTGGIANVRVVRNSGEGNLTAIKFIVEDNQNADIFDVDVDYFPRLAERTFQLNLSESEILTLYEINKISIVPVYISGTGAGEVLGDIADSQGGLNKNLNITIIKENIEVTCQKNTDCGTDGPIEGTEVCSQDGRSVLQYKKTFLCSLGFCSNEVSQDVKETCLNGWNCYEGKCIEVPPKCSVENIATNCGEDGFVGIQKCATNPERIVQDYRTYSCNDGECSETTTSKTRLNCPENEVCGGSPVECFVPLECTSNADCHTNPDYGPEYICVDGNCKIETALYIGGIRSAWPFGVQEYFDSADLPKDEQTASEMLNKYIVFPGSLQSGCLTIKEFVVPTFEGGISYIRLNETKTNITDNDNFQIWETNYVCSLY